MTRGQTTIPIPVNVLCRTRETFEYPNTPFEGRQSQSRFVFHDLPTNQTLLDKVEGRVEVCFDVFLLYFS